MGFSNWEYRWGEVAITKKKQLSKKELKYYGLENI